MFFNVDFLTCFYNDFGSIWDLKIDHFENFFVCFFEAETQLEKNTKRTPKIAPKSIQDKPVWQMNGKRVKSKKDS